MNSSAVGLLLSFVASHGKLSCPHGECTRTRSRCFCRNRSSDSSTVTLTSLSPSRSFGTLEEMNKPLLFTEPSRSFVSNTSPMSRSLPYEYAVSMCWYPMSRAESTAACTEALVTWHVPKPMDGIRIPLLRRTKPRDDIADR